jgi:SAM-dependent methyltransferase
LEQLCCPACRGDLRETGIAEAELRCEACNRTYPVILGIPDLRIFADPYIGLEADRAKGKRLAALAADTDFAGLLAAYYAMPDTEDSPAQAKQFTAGLLAAPARARAVLAQWQALAGRPAAPQERFLEIGCGTAPLLIAAAKQFGAALGVDIAFRWLVVARKRLQEAGCDVPLICACAEALPLRSGTRDVVAAESTFEVTRDPTVALGEARRVMKSSGALWLTTPNRLSLGPDPHLGLPAGGWWPRPLVEAWAQRRGELAPQRQLQTAGSLRTLLETAGFRDIRVALPDIADAQRAALAPASSAAAGIYQMVKDLPGLHELMLTVAPTLLATAAPAT